MKVVELRFSPATIRVKTKDQNNQMNRGLKLWTGSSNVNIEGIQTQILTILLKMG